VISNNKNARIRRLVNKFRKEQRELFAEEWSDQIEEYNDHEKALREAGSNDTQEKLLFMMKLRSNF